MNLTEHELEMEKARLVREIMRKVDRVIVGCGLIALASLVALFLTSCAFEPAEDRPFTPPASYRAVFDSAQACTGRAGDFDYLRFFTMPGVSFESPNGGQVAAFTQGHTIWIAEAYTNHPLVVKHEMIHALGFPSGHPADPFESPCHATWSTYRGPSELE